jgi:magnesium-transporting ATPase (P-type)
MVLADDNFASIAAAVEEGRTIYDNIRKAIVFILPTNGGQAGVLVAAILLGLQLPITPAQILWVNMVTAVTLALALAFEPAERDIMRRPPRDPVEPLLTPFMLWRIAFVSLLLVGGSLAIFLWQVGRGADVEVARTATVNLLLVGEVFYLFNCRRMTSPVLSFDGLFGSRYVLVAIALLLAMQMLFTYLPVMQTLFKTAPIDATTWGLIFLFGVAVLLVVEVEKIVARRNGWR